MAVTPERCSLFERNIASVVLGDVLQHAETLAETKHKFMFTKPAKGLLQYCKRNFL